MAMMTRKPYPEHGFMYVELLAAVVILAFALLAAGPMFILAARENAAAGDLTSSWTLANARAENMKRLPYAVLATGHDNPMVGQMTFARTWVVEDDTPHPGMRTVTVTVTPQRTVRMGENRVATLRFYRIP